MKIEEVKVAEPEKSGLQITLGLELAQNPDGVGFYVPSAPSGNVNGQHVEDPVGCGPYLGAAGSAVCCFGSILVAVSGAINCSLPSALAGTFCGCLSFGGFYYNVNNMFTQWIANAPWAVQENSAAANVAAQANMPMAAQGDQENVVRMLAERDLQADIARRLATLKPEDPGYDEAVKFMKRTHVVIEGPRGELVLATSELTKREMDEHKSL